MRKLKAQNVEFVMNQQAMYNSYQTRKIPERNDTSGQTIAAYLTSMLHQSFLQLRIWLGFCFLQRIKLKHFIQARYKFNKNCAQGISLTVTKRAGENILNILPRADTLIKEQISKNCL